MSKSKVEEDKKRQREIERERELYTHTHTPRERKETNLSQLFHLVGAYVRAVSESKVEEEPLSVEVLALHSLAGLIDLQR